MPARMLTLCTLALAAVALLFAACGGGDEEDTPEAAATTLATTVAERASTATTTGATASPASSLPTTVQSGNARVTVRMTGAANVSGTYPARCSFFDLQERRGMFFDSTFEGWKLSVVNDKERTEGRQNITRDALGLPTGTAVMLQTGSDLWGLRSSDGPITDEVTVGPGASSVRVKVERKKLLADDVVQVEAEFNCG